MKILNLSGGGTKIVGIFSVANTLIQAGWKPDVITGVSAGSYLALPLAMGKHKEAEQLLIKISSEGMLDVMFDPSPVTEKGSIKPRRVLHALINKKAYLGKQNKSLQLLRDIISEQEFNEWAANPNSVHVWALSVDFISGGKVFRKLNDETYENALQFILASGSIPVFIDYVEYTDEDEDYVLYDGGVRSHIACREVLDVYKKGLDGTEPVKEMISIYSRPKDYRDEKWRGWRPADLSTPLLRLLDIMTIEISKACEYAELVECAQRNIKLTQIFLPAIMTDVYDVNPDRLEKLRLAGIDEAIKALEIKELK